MQAKFTKFSVEPLPKNSRKSSESHKMQMTYWPAEQLSSSQISNSMELVVSYQYWVESAAV